MNERDAIFEASQQLKNGHVILCPATPTWSLSCDATNESAVEKLLDISKCPPNDGLVILVNSDRMINQLVKDFPEILWDLIDLATEPLTVILEGGKYVSKNALAGDGKIAIRMIKSGIYDGILNRFNRPIAIASLSASADSTANTFGQLISQIKDKVDFILPEALANSEESKPSKIIELRSNGEVKVLRK